MRGKGFLFFVVILFKPQKTIQEWSVPSLLPMKKIPMPRGDEERRIMPATMDSLKKVYTFYGLWDGRMGKVQQPTGRRGVQRSRLTVYHISMDGAAPEREPVP